ncbi:DUF4190 domain-containing protein [Streptomyces collinus]|uniref:DUF4190 domain-containing protein n=1 Tax=Streptomyces collinus TaxID=42684 RepID=UPI0036820191
MSEQVPQPIPPEYGAGEGSVAPEGSAPRVSLDKGSGREPADPAGAERSAPDGATTPTPAAGVEADPWAPRVSPQGAGATVVSDAFGASPFSGPSDTPAAAAPASQPPVHDQRTVASLPAPDAPADPVPPAWAKPADPFAPTAPAPSAPGRANPFAPPAGMPSAPGQAAPPAPPAAAAANPFAPPSGASANPFAPPGPGTQAGAPVHPYAPPAPAGPGNPYMPPPAAAARPQESVPVPPPPMSPDGPGQVPYGYPGAPAAYGYPAPQPHPGYGGPGIPAYPAAGYGWPGMQPQPNNGMGTAALVLGILSVVGFCAWPLAIVMAILAVVLGALGRAKARRGEADNPGVALAGIICGAASIVLMLGLLAFAIAYYD